MSTSLPPDLVFISALLALRHPALAGHLAAVLPRRPRLIPGTRDIWCRDYMPVQTGPGRFVQFRYRPDYLRDEPGLRTNDAATLLGLMGCRRSTLVMDGGNILRHGDTAIVTDKIYRENRRLAQQASHNQLRQELEVERLIVIPAEPGDILGHADGMLRFVDEKTLLVSDYRQELPSYSQGLEALLRGYGFELVWFPWAPTDEVGRDGIASAQGVYINFLQTADLICCPVFGQRQDEEAVKLLEQCFPKHRIVPVACRELAAEGGLLHCVTWQVLS